MSDPVMDQELWKLAPGTAAARAQGCICEADQAAEPELDTPGFEGQAFQPFRVETQCPLHGLAVTRELIGRG